MAGRRRRSSNSTVGTVDDSQLRCIQESAVLRPFSPQSEEQEPIFVLSDAIIYTRDGKRMANPLLDIHREGPLMVRGKLGIDKDQKYFLTKLYHKNARIEIPASSKYSIGYGTEPDSDAQSDAGDDFSCGPVTIWMFSASGWFEIQPAPQYKAMYNEICEGVTLYYEIQKVYDDHKQSMKALKKKDRTPPPNLNEVFFKYAMAVGDGSLRHEVEERCHKWALFLISHFPSEEEFSWEGIEFVDWIKNAHPETVKKLADAAAAENLAPPPPKVEDAATATIPGPKGRSTRTSRRGSEGESAEDVDMNDAPALPQPRHIQTVERPKMKTNSPQPPLPQPTAAPAQSYSSPAPEADLSPVDAIIIVLEEIREEMGDLRAKKASHVYNKIYFKCKIKTYALVSDVVIYYGKELLDHLDSSWRDTLFYNWLKKQSKLKRNWDADWVRSLPHQLTRRKDTKPNPSASNGVKRQSASAGLDLDSDEDPPPGKRLQPGRRSGKGATLRPGAKRPASELDDGVSSGSGRGRKFAKRAHGIDDNDPDLDDEEDSDDVGDDDNSDDRPGLPPVRVVVHAEKIPTMSPTGPNGTWVCEEEGCSYFVRNAEASEGVEEIKRHFSDHAAQADRITLAQAEGLRGHAPINHLLEKIQAMGKKALIAEHRAAGPAPNVIQPIKRRLLV